MAKKQSRRTVSMSRAMYDALTARADVLGISAAKYVHECVAREMRDAGVEPPAHVAHADWCDLVRRPGKPRVFHRIARVVKLDFDPARALENPCRHERCMEQRLHVAHERPVSGHNGRKPGSRNRVKEAA